MINISANPDFHNSHECIGLTDFDFSTITFKLGHGIILLNNRAKNAPYNMHLGAIVALEGGNIYLSDVSEDGDVYLTKDWDVKRVQSLNQFRGTQYAGAKGFAMGLLMAEPYFK